MERTRFDFSAVAVALIVIAILFSACSMGKNVDPNGGTTKPNESISTTEPTTKPDEIITTTEPTTSENESDSEEDDEIEAIYSYHQCLIAPSDDYSIELLGTQDFPSGYLLIQEDWKSEYELLLAQKMKKTDYLAEFKNSVYGVTENNEIIEVNKTDGSYKTVYTAKHGSIDYISGVICVNRYVYFNDGNYIIELDPVTNKCTEKFKSDKGIYRIFAGGDVVKLNDLSFYCDTCLEREDYFIWQDSKDENYYWHHPETGKDELIDNFFNVHTYGDYLDRYQDLYIWKVEK